MSRNSDYTTGNVLDFSYHQNCYKLIGIDLSRQIEYSSMNSFGRKIKR